MIKSIDNQQPNNAQIFEIVTSKCISCGQEYDKERNMRFVELSSGKVIWWHVSQRRNGLGSGCRYVSKYKKQKKIIPKPAKNFEISFEDFCNECDLKKIKKGLY